MMFTVILAPNDSEDYWAHVEDLDIDKAVETAREEAMIAHGFDGDGIDFFRVVAVFHGWLEDAYA